MLNDAKMSQFVKSHFKAMSKQSNVDLSQFSKTLIEK